VSAVRCMIGFHCSRELVGVDLGGRGDSAVCAGDNLIGEIDQSTPCWLWQRDQLIGRDLTWRGLRDAFVARLALLDREFRFPLGSHADDARGSDQARVVDGGVSDHIDDVERGDRAEIKGLDRLW